MHIRSTAPIAVDVKIGEVLRIDDHGGPPMPITDIPYDQNSCRLCAPR